jgi:AcrR family transcriptional regulator
VTGARNRTSRDGIVAAALALTAEKGWEATSLQAVRHRAGVSNGSLFHHFPSREDLAGAVVGAGMSAHQDDLLAEVRAAATARGAITGVVQRHLRWVANQQQLARLLLSAAPETLRAGLSTPVLTANRSFFTEVAVWLTGHGWAGAPPLSTVAALWLGPAQYYARGWLAAPDDSLPDATTSLADGAWRALSPLLDLEDT